MIENTTSRDPLIHLAGTTGSGGLGSYIEEMESAGQSQLVASEMLPARINHGSQAEMEELGFTFGDSIPGDDLFRKATLPAGWKRQGSEHAMWSYVLDEHGRRRVSIFYKAAFYDRDAFMSLIGLGGYLWSVATGQEPLVLDDVWATREAVLAELGARIASEDEQAVTYGISHAKEAARYRRLRARVRKATR